MSHYDYAVRGNNCFPATCALTSNKKYLPLTDPAYYLMYTKTEQYPGQTYDFIRRLKDVHSPEDIKAHLDGGGVRPATLSAHGPVIDPHNHGHPGHPHEMHDHKPKPLDLAPKKRSCNTCATIY